MSDDLISRKALKQAIDHDFYEHYTKYHDTDQTALFDMVMDDIDEMPVAFDKEKVIESIKIVTAGDVLNYNYPSEYVQGCVDMSKEIIKIIEKGGIE